MENTAEVKRLEKKVMMTRFSGVIYLLILVVGSLLNVPLEILAPLVILMAAAFVIFVGVPAQKKLRALRRQIAEEGSDSDE